MFNSIIKNIIKISTVSTISFFTMYGLSSFINDRKRKKNPDLYKEYIDAADDVINKQKNYISDARKTISIAEEIINNQNQIIKLQQEKIKDLEKGK